MQCLQDVLKHVEETEQSEQLQSVDPVTSSVHEATVSASSSNSVHTAVDPKYVQLLGDKAAVSVNCKCTYIPNYHGRINIKLTTMLIKYYITTKCAKIYDIIN